MERDRFPAARVVHTNFYVGEKGILVDAVDLQKLLRELASKLRLVVELDIGIPNVGRVFIKIKKQKDLRMEEKDKRVKRNRRYQKDTSWSRRKKQ